MSGPISREDRLRWCSLVRFTARPVARPIMNSSPILRGRRYRPKPVNRIEVFAGDRIDGVRLTYPSGGGPNGQTQIVCGDPFHSTGVTLFADQDPLVEVTVYAGDIVSALSFEAKNGDQSGQIANNKPPGSEVTVLWAPPGEIISSVYINGTDQFYQSANLIIFGFQYQRKATADLTALRHLYVVSPSADRSDSIGCALRDQACVDRCAEGRDGNGRVGCAAPTVPRCAETTCIGQVHRANILTARGAPQDDLVLWRNVSSGAVSCTTCNLVRFHVEEEKKLLIRSNYLTECL
jgi:hypothetical protein